MLLNVVTHNSFHLKITFEMNN